MKSDIALTDVVEKSEAGRRTIIGIPFRRMQLRPGRLLEVPEVCP